MKPSKILSVLMPCLASRPWQKLSTELEHQRESLTEELKSSVEILLLVDHGEATSGAKRNELTQKSVGEYIAFVDDDDEISPNYLTSILNGCLQKPDVVAFNLRFTSADDPKLDEIWKFGLYPNQRKRGLMAINHLCAWKREIATKVAWCPDLGNGDDQLWFQPLIHANIIKKVHRIDEVLYFYKHDSSVSVNQTPDKIRKRQSYAENGLRCFLIDGGIWIEVPPKRAGIVRARNRLNQVLSKPKKLWPLPYHVVHIK